MNNWMPKVNPPPTADTGLAKSSYALVREGKISSRRQIDKLRGEVPEWVEGKDGKRWRGRRLTLAERANRDVEIISMRDGGMGINEIAEKTGSSRGTVDRVLQAHGKTKPRVAESADPPVAAGPVRRRRTRAELDHDNALAECRKMRTYVERQDCEDDLRHAEAQAEAEKDLFAAAAEHGFTVTLEFSDAPPDGAIEAATGAESPTEALRARGDEDAQQQTEDGAQSPMEASCAGAPGTRSGMCAMDRHDKCTGYRSPSGLLPCGCAKHATD